MPSDVRVARTKWKREQPRAEFIGRTAFSNDQIAESHQVTMANTAASTRHMKSSANRPTADKSASRSRRIRGRQILESSERERQTRRELRHGSDQIRLAIVAPGYRPSLRRSTSPTGF